MNWFFTVTSGVYTFFNVIKSGQILIVILPWVKVLSITYFPKTMAWSVQTGMVLHNRLVSTYTKLPIS